MTASLGRTAARLGRIVELSLCDVELSSAQYRLLGFLADRTLAASALATGLGVSRPSITAVADGLVERGLLARAEDPADRRRVSHRLTAAGVEILGRAETAVDATLREVAGLLDGDEGPRAIEGLDIWRTALDRYYEQMRARRTAA